MSDATFWNERYQQSDYAYGKTPNLFYFTELQKLTPGKLLLPFEGEGRNAVAAAKLNWEVTAFDISEKGKDKAGKLAEENHVQIDYKLGELSQLALKDNSFDAIALIYAHLPPAMRSSFHQTLISKLKPGGWLILEAFHPKQLGNPSGGPKQLDMLYTEDLLAADFAELKIILLTNTEVELDEGLYHKGKAHVVRMVARK
jgi:hypothetical protein